MPEMQHAAGQTDTCLVDFDGMAATCQMPCGRQAARTRSDHQHTLAGARRIKRARSSRRRLPGRRENARRHGCLPRYPGRRGCNATRTGGNRRGRARRAADCRVSAFPRPRGSRAGLRMYEPRLDVFARRAGRIARRQQVHVDRTLRTRGSSACGARQVDRRRHVFGLRIGHLNAPRSGSARVTAHRCVHTAGARLRCPFPAETAPAGSPRRCPQYRRCRPSGRPAG